MPEQRKYKKRSLLPEFLLARHYPGASKPLSRLTLQLTTVRHVLLLHTITKQQQKKAACVLEAWESHLLQQTATLLQMNPKHTGIVLDTLSNDKILQAFVFARALLTKRTGKTFEAGSTACQADLYKFFDCICAKVAQDQSGLIKNTNRRINNKNAHEKRRAEASVPEKRQGAQKCETICTAD